MILDMLVIAWSLSMSNMIDVFVKTKIKLRLFKKNANSKKKTKTPKTGKLINRIRFLNVVLIIGSLNIAI